MTRFRRTLKVLGGVAGEIWWRIRGHKWRLCETIVWNDVERGKTLTAPEGMMYDRFTLFPNLRKLDGTMSDGSPLHDVGWDVGEWDDGTELTFDENNAMLVKILEAEDQRSAVIEMVAWGVSLWFMRRKWRKMHGHE